jgi:hypothetical protein
MIYPTDVEGQIRNNGYYDPFPYRFWSYPKTARNIRENRPWSQPITYLADRVLRPKMLCFLDAVSNVNLNGLLPQDKWGNRDPTYIFVSYTGQGQFERRCKNGNDCRCKYISYYLSILSTFKKGLNR